MQNSGKNRPRSTLENIGIGCAVAPIVLFLLLFGPYLLVLFVLGLRAALFAVSTQHPLYGLLVPVVAGTLLSLPQAPRCLMIRSEPTRDLFPWTFLLIRNPPDDGETRPRAHSVRRATLLLGCCSFLLLLPTPFHGLVYWAVGGTLGTLCYRLLVDHFRRLRRSRRG